VASTASVHSAREIAAHAFGNVYLWVLWNEVGTAGWEVPLRGEHADRAVVSGDQI
jgi:hypothetical protein